MTDDERKEMRRRCWRRWYQEMKQDPAKYAYYLRRHRAWQKEYEARRKAQREEDWQEFRNVVNNGAKIWSDKSYE